MRRLCRHACASRTKSSPTRTPQGPSRTNCAVFWQRSSGRGSCCSRPPSTLLLYVDVRPPPAPPLLLRRRHHCRPPICPGAPPIARSVICAPDALLRRSGWSASGLCCCARKHRRGIFTLRCACSSRAVRVCVCVCVAQWTPVQHAKRSCPGIKHGAPHVHGLTAAATPTEIAVAGRPCNTNK